MTDDDFDRLQDEFDLCGVDGRLRDFADAIEAAEREACASVCEAIDERHIGGDVPDHALTTAAREIRQRSNDRVQRAAEGRPPGTDSSAAGDVVKG